MRSLLFVAVTGSLLVARPEAVDACSCAFEMPRVWPEDGADAVPLNAKLHVGEYYTTLREVSLRPAEAAEEVPLTIDEHSGDGFGRSHAIASPDALAPRTRYLVTVRTDYSTVESSFTTGDAADTTPPTFAGLESIRLETMASSSDCISSCVEAREGRISRIHLGYTYPEDAVIVRFELFDATRFRLGEAIVNRAYPKPTYLGFETCEVRAPTLQPGMTYCARLTAYDLAGNESGAAVEVCGEAARCATEYDGMCSPAATCRPEDGEDPGLVMVPGPGGCSTSRGANGLALVLLPIGAALLRRRRRA